MIIKALQKKLIIAQNEMEKYNERFFYGFTD